MSVTPKIGLLPLYLALYDDKLPEERARFAPFLTGLPQALGRQGLALVVAPVCRVRREIAAAVKRFEQAEVDLVVTLHLAYSPSLEAAAILAETRLPLLMFDTTMDAEFTPKTPPARIMYNHGIHGVQDLASMLRRLGRRPEIVAGHWQAPEVLPRVAGIARAAAAARQFHTSRVLRLGKVFAGMGDFQVAPEVLRHGLGIAVEQAAPSVLAAAVRAVTAKAVAAEVADDRRRYAVSAPLAVHQRSVKLALGLRRFLAEGGYTAFSFNFQAFDTSTGPVDTVPFLEASKAMARGLGYAGEGDVLTAALVGALAATFGDTSFTEIFCPDWKHNVLFLSHMGEVNPDLLAGTPELVEKPFPFTPAHNPAMIAGAFRPGAATLVNLVPGPDDRFSLVLAPVEMLPEPRGAGFAGQVRGWLRPALPVAAFLERYSMAGGTHHSALVYGHNRLEPLQAFARFQNWSCEIIA